METAEYTIREGEFFGSEEAAGSDPAAHTSRSRGANVAAGPTDGSSKSKVKG